MKRLLFVMCALIFCCLVFAGCNKSSSTETEDLVRTHEFVTIPAGDFTYGSDNETRTIEYDYQIMKYEVTNRMFVDFLNQALEQGLVSVIDGSVTGTYAGDEKLSSGEYEYYDLDMLDAMIARRISWNGANFSIDSDYENHPVIYVTWLGAAAFANHFGYRLPTDEEWEKAARGLTGFNYPWGNDIQASNANYSQSNDPFEWGTTPVGFYDGSIHDGFQTIDSPSPYGAYDMAGNVWEWTATYLDESSPYLILRGGSWGFPSPFLQSWITDDISPVSSDYDLGFRCVK